MSASNISVVDEAKYESITKDNGLKKRILRPGTGDVIPSSKVRAVVHYTGTLLNGTVFDSSKKRQLPFQFSLNQRHVILGWDVGVATMRKGEVCSLICSPDYAYGSRAMGPIPANATLVFEVELLDWIEEKDEKWTRFLQQFTFVIVGVFILMFFAFYSKLTK